MSSCSYKNRDIFRFTGFIVAFLVAVGANHLIVAAQQPLEWSPQQRIPGYTNDTKSPHLVVDQNRTVHAFTSQWVDEDEFGENKPDLAIFYNKWTLDLGWTEPIDVLLSPLQRQARLHGAFLDQNGMIHVIFFGGDNREANIYYSRAAALVAGQAPAWSQPLAIGDRAINPDTAALAGDDQGNLFIMYSGDRDTNGLYAIQSNDGGDTWSAPVQIFSTYSLEILPFALQAHMDKNNRLHAVWGIVGPEGNGLAIYYTQLESAQAEWREPTLIAEVTDFEADTPNLIAYNDELFIIYHNGFPTTRWMTRSSDNGESWTPPLQLFSQVGSNGAASFVIDSNNVLHLFFGNRLDFPATHGMWHSVWLGANWSPPQAVVSGPLFKDSEGGAGFDPSFAKAAVAQGNTILLTWTTDPAAGFNGVWYSSASIEGAPELPVVPLPATLVTATPAPTVTPMAPAPTATPTPRRPRPAFTADQNGSFSETASNPSFPLIVGLVPVILLISALIVLYSLNLTYRG